MAVLAFLTPALVAGPRCSGHLRLPSPPPKTRTLFRPLVPHPSTSAIVAGAGGVYNIPGDLDFSYLPGDEDSADERACPWEGAVMHRRDTPAHAERRTSLERLGLSRLSSALSRQRAGEMGLMKKGQEAEEITPVVVSIGVARRKRRVRLDGIVKTVITLQCNRCGEPAAEAIFSNFSLLLCEDPVEEPSEITIRMTYERDDADADDDEDVDTEDRLHFPAEAKEIDISKHIRDIIHVEITINALCSPGCRGVCLRCGANLNRSSCRCSKAKDEEGKSAGSGPLKDLRERMQRR